jgi:hypothetical protein
MLGIIILLITIIWFSPIYAEFCLDITILNTYVLRIFGAYGRACLSSALVETLPQYGRNVPIYPAAGT